MGSPNRPSAARSTLVVHETSRPPAPVLRYVDQVLGSPTDIEFRFSMGVLTRFDVDVVHVADPQLHQLLGTKGAAGYQHVLAALVLTRNLRRHGIALVRTLDAFEADRRSTRFTRWAKRILDNATTRFIAFDETVTTPDPSRTTIIPHANFRDRFIGYPMSDMTPGRVLCISTGALGDEAAALLALPRTSQVDGVTVRLAGTADPSIEPRARSAIARHAATVSTRFEPLSDGALAQEISAAEIVVMHDVESFAGIQLLYLILSLDRPVVIPRSDVTARIADAVGALWMHLVDGPITPESVDRALEAVRRPDRPARPSLDGRDLAATHAAYEQVFRDAADRVLADSAA